MDAASPHVNIPPEWSAGPKEAHDANKRLCCLPTMLLYVARVNEYVREDV